MRLEVEHTLADWQAYLRFATQRTAAQRRQLWLVIFSVALGSALLLSALAKGEGWRFDAWSALIAIGFVMTMILVMTRLNRRLAGVPHSWLGPQAYELYEDGIHCETASGRSFVRWQAVRDIVETPDHLFIMLDEIVALIVPTRGLSALGGTAAVRAELERLRGSAAPADSQSTHVEVASVAAQAPGIDSTPVPGGMTPAPGPSRWLALPRNLLAGLRLFVFAPVRAQDFSPSSRQAVLLAILALGAWVIIDRLRHGSDAYLAWYSVGMVAGLAALAFATLLILAPRPRSSDHPAALPTAAAAVAPFLVLLGIALALLPVPDGFTQVIVAVLPLITVFALYRAHRVSIEDSALGAGVRAIAVVLILWGAFANTLYAAPQFWFSASDAASEESREDWSYSENALFRQPDLIDGAVERMRGGEQGTTDTFFVGFAGYGEQDVFGKEVRFAHEALGRRIDLRDRGLELVNSPSAGGDDAPLATVSGLRRALAGVAQRMNLEEDVLILFLTSHGDEDAELSVTQDILPLEPLRGKALRAALDDAGIRWRIVVISACHSGSFIPFLRDEHTLIATAARADRSSFGCTDERELTYYGEALFRDALPESRDFLDALARARSIVQKHEAQEDIRRAERSEPQVYVGQRMRAKLAELSFRATG